MADTLPIPDEASDKDRQRIEQVNRNLRIRDAYPDLRDEHGRDEAFRLLADRHSVSKSLVHEVVYERR